VLDQHDQPYWKEYGHKELSKIKQLFAGQNLFTQVVKQYILIANDDIIK